MFNLVDTLQTYSRRYNCLASSSILFPFLLFFRKKFGFFFYRKRVKFSAISPGLPKRTQLTQPRYHGFSAAFPLAEMACTINVSFSLHNSGECNLDEKYIGFDKHCKDFTYCKNHNCNQHSEPQTSYSSFNRNWIGHFLLPKILTLKTRISANPFL